MVNSYKLNNILSIYIKNNKISFEDFMFNGISSREISFLVESKILSKNKEGYYEFVNIDYLYNYGLQLVNSGNLGLAKKVFLKVIKLNKYFIDAYYSLFLISINNSNYKEALKYIDYFYDDERFTNDANVFLLLLSEIISLNEEYQEILDNLTYEDVLDQSGIDGDSLNELNNMRINVLKYVHREIGGTLNFGYCDRVLNNINFSNMTLKILMSRIKIKCKKRKKNIVNLLSVKDYDGVVNYLSDRKLNLEEKYILKVLKDLLGVECIVDEVSSIDTNNVYEAIDVKDYALALKLAIQYSEKRGLNFMGNPLYVLLLEINTKIDKFSHFRNVLSLK